MFAVSRGAKAILLVALLLPGALAQAPGTRLPGQDAEPAPQPAAFPDLMIHRMWVNPYPPTEEKAFEVCADLQNYGAAVVQDFTAMLFVDGEEVAYKRFRDFPKEGYVLCGAAEAAMGDHLLEVYVDYEREVREMNEDNNYRSGYFDVRETPYADLFVRDFRATPDPPRRGESMVLDARVKNGGQAASGNVSVQFLWDGEVLAERVVPALPPGYVYPVALVLDADRLPEGTFTVGVRIDPDDRVKELVESNNEHQRQIHLPVRPRPELTVTNVSWGLAQPDPDRGELRDGDLLNLTATIRNLGNDAADPVKVRFVLDNETTVGAPRTPRLRPGEAAVVHTLWSARGGNFTVDVLVDEERTLPELNLTNNRAAFNLTITPKPPQLVLGDLAITRLLHMPSRLTPDAPASFTAVLTNRGFREVPGFQLAFLVNGTEFARYRMGSIPVEGFLASTATWPQPALGEWTVTVVADPDDEVPETNESNNRLDLPARVLEPLPAPPQTPPPVTNETPDPEEPDARPPAFPSGPPPAPPEPGHVEAVRVVARPDNETEEEDYRFVLEVLNPKESVAASFTVSFYVDGSQHGPAIPVPGLQPGMRRPIASEPWVGEPGEHTILALVEADDGTAWPSPKATTTVAVDEPKGLPWAALAAPAALLAAAALRRRRD